MTYRCLDLVTWVLRQNAENVIWLPPKLCKIQSDKIKKWLRKDGSVSRQNVEGIWKAEALAWK